MADTKNAPAKPFASGIISQTSGKAAETIQRSYANEVARGRSHQKAVPIDPCQKVEKKG
jgi:hypothetical protein